MGGGVDVGVKGRTTDSGVPGTEEEEDDENEDEEDVMLLLLLLVEVCW